MKKNFLTLVLAIALLAAGCAKEKIPEPQTQPVTEVVTEATTEATVPSELELYLESIVAQSESIKYRLENEDMSQADMNIASQELYDLWDDALNHLWGLLKTRLPEEEFSPLLEEQRQWIAHKEEAVAAAGKEVEGGSIYPLVIYGEGAKWTEERTYQLYDLLLTLA